MSQVNPNVVQGTEELLLSLCNSVTRVLNVATNSQVQYSGVVQRIQKTYLKPDIGCFVLFDGGFSGLVIINLSAASAMELYRNYLLNMGLSESDLATSYTSDEVSNVMGELMNQVVGDFTGKVRRELQTHITQNQPKMLVLNKQVQLSVDANLDNPEARRVTFYTAANNIFYLELAVDRTEFITLRDFTPEAELDADAIMAAAGAPAPSSIAAATAATAAAAASTDALFSASMAPAAPSAAAAPASTTPASGSDAETEALLKSLGM